MSQENGQKDDVIDPELKEELEEKQIEDPLITEYGSGADSGGENKDIDFAQEWFPEEDNWQGKTIITPEQAHALAAVRNLTKIFDEINDLDSFLNGMVNDYEQYLTSIEGISREQQVDILSSMFTKESRNEKERRDMILSAFAGNAGEENE